MANPSVLSSRVELACHRVAMDGDWDGVSGRRPCPVCGAQSDCSLHVDDAFVSCAHRPSDWPLTNGSWLHRLSPADVAPLGLPAGRRP
jgi:hypothetical protein